MAIKIDLNRGVEMRMHRTGMAVYMYLDDPGVYLTAFGDPIAEKVAKEAGFPVARLAKDRDVKARMKAAQKAILAEYSNYGERQIVEERQGFKLVHVGENMYNIEGPQGEILNSNGPLAKKIAKSVFESTVPAEQEEPTA